MSWIIYPVLLPQTRLKNVANLVKSNQWLHAYMVYVDTASQTVVSGLEMSTKCHFCCCKCGWKCPFLSKISHFVISKHSWKCHDVSVEIPDVVASNTAGHFAMSHQKCRRVLCHKQLEMSRRLLENTQFSRHKHSWKCYDGFDATDIA